MEYTILHKIHYQKKMCIHPTLIPLSLSLSLRPDPDKYMVAWKRGIAILTAGKVKVTPDPRVQLAAGYTLLIRNATHQDAGEYNCQIATMEPTEITHTVDILSEYTDAQHIVYPQPN